MYGTRIQATVYFYMQHILGPNGLSPDLRRTKKEHPSLGDVAISLYCLLSKNHRNVPDIPTVKFSLAVVHSATFVRNFSFYSCKSKQLEWEYESWTIFSENPLLEMPI